MMTSERISLDQVVVAEGEAALGDDDAMAAEALGLGHYRTHVPRREELSLLQVDRRAGAAPPPLSGRSGAKAAPESAARRPPRPSEPPARARECRSAPGVRFRALPARACASPPRRPGPRNESWLVRLALSNDDLKTYRNAACARNRGQPLRVAQAGLRAFDHARPRDQHEARAAENHRARRYLATSHDTALSARTLAERSGAVSARRTTAARMSPRNSGWQIQRTRAQLGMELAAEEPWMAREFHDFDQLIVGRSAGGHEADLLQRLAIVVVDFVAMTMALGDAAAAVERERERART